MCMSRYFDQLKPNLHCHLRLLLALLLVEQVISSVVCVFVLCIRFVYSFCVFVLCIRFVYLFCVFVLCIRFVYSFCVFVLCIRFVYSFCVFVLCIRSVLQRSRVTSTGAPPWCTPPTTRSSSARAARVRCVCLTCDRDNCDTHSRHTMDQSNALQLTRKKIILCRGQQREILRYFDYVFKFRCEFVLILLLATSLFFIYKTNIMFLFA